MCNDRQEEEIDTSTRKPNAVLIEISFGGNETGDFNCHKIKAVFLPIHACGRKSWEIS